MMFDQPLDRCPVCRVSLEPPAMCAGDFAAVVDCAGCGRHVFGWRLVEYLNRFDTDRKVRANLAHQVSKLPAGTEVDLMWVGQVIERTRLPGPLERIDLMVQLLGSSRGIGEGLDLLSLATCVHLGCEDEMQVLWVAGQAGRRGFVDTKSRVTSLTAEGWEHFDKLQRSALNSRHAFMAMRFGDAELDRIYQDHMIPAVAATDFTLRTVNGPHQTAGSIDNRMRVEIRNSRFLVCDLTHGNRGAYWEAGFAEGLGRPVFYVCRADVLDSKDREVAPHFDTRQQLIIPWHPDNPGPGMQKLKDAIRATLPDLARMED